jgi:murein DD-endopeptidase MepM/ murein hydrolase activator NlpD
VAIDVPHKKAAEQEFEQNRTLLETNYKFVMQYVGGEESLWNLPEARSVDVAVLSNSVYVLQREMFDPAGIISKYTDTRSIEEFGTEIQIIGPRQIVATETAVFILDSEGRRLLALDPDDGGLLQLVQLPQEDPVSVFALDPSGRIYLAGRDRLYFIDQPERLASVLGGPTLAAIQLHDPLFLQKLDYFTVPIGGSNITFRDFQMPGAPRHYRLGVHEGLDLYWQPGTKVIAAADGQVIRADRNYVDPTSFQLGTWWNETQEQGYTTREILNLYMGRQVWIQHEDGLISRYGHLRSIEPGIVDGVQVSRGQVIGEVGNSGSPASLESESSDAHLHFELRLEDSFLGQFLRPIETREWIEKIFPSR